MLLWRGVLSHYYYTNAPFSCCMLIASSFRSRAYLQQQMEEMQRRAETAEVRGWHLNVCVYTLHSIVYIYFLWCLKCIYGPTHNIIIFWINTCFLLTKITAQQRALAAETALRKLKEKDAAEVCTGLFLFFLFYSCMRTHAHPQAHPKSTHPHAYPYISCFNNMIADKSTWASGADRRETAAGRHWTSRTRRSAIGRGMTFMFSCVCYYIYVKWMSDCQRY